MQKTECFKFQQLDAYKVAREIAVRVHEARISDAELGDQGRQERVPRVVRRVAEWPAVTETLPPAQDMPGLRRRYFTQSRNSVCELAGAIDLSAAIGAMNTGKASAILALYFA